MTPPPPPPPPPPASVATSLAIQAGDNQSAGAGSRVPVVPTVIVKDQNGNPMAGVSVAFAVDSGGGVVVNATSSTAADGTASSGGWQLGFGRNRLRATAGTLTPVVFTATATGELQVVDTTITTSGGTIVVRRPGTPIDGVQLVIPTGVVSTPTRFTVQFGDSTGMPRPRGFRPISPVISVTTSEAVTVEQKPGNIVVPGTVAPGELPVLLFFDRASGAFVPAPAVVSNGAIRGLLTTLNGGSIAPPGGGASRFAASSNVSSVVQLVIGAINYSDLNRALDTGYDPAVDDWEFALELTRTPPNSRFAVAGAMAVTAGWYFMHEKRARGALKGKYARNPNIEPSNVLGIRLANMVGLELDLTPAMNYQQAMDALAQVAAVPRDSLTLLAVKAHLFVTGQPYILFGENSSDPNVAGTVLVWSAQGNRLGTSFGATATGAQPGTQFLQYSNGTFSGLQLGVTQTDTRIVELHTLDIVAAAGPTAGIGAAALRTHFANFFSGTIAKGTILVPSWELVSREGRGWTDTLFVSDDTTRFWLECSGLGCDYSYPVTGNFVPRGKVAGGSVWTSPTGSRAMTRLGGGAFMAGGGLPLDATKDSGRRVGLVIGVSGPAQKVGETRYVDWTEFVVMPKRLVITPKLPNVQGGYDFTMRATYARPTPARASWRWVLGDGRVITTTQDSLTTRYPVPTDSAIYQVKVSLLSDTTVEATGRTTVTVKKPRFTWRMQQATVQATTLPSGGIGSSRSDTAIRNLTTQLITNLAAAPNNTGIFMEGLANGSGPCDAGVLLQQFPAGQFSDTLATTIIPMALLGICGDPDYTGTLSLGPLGTGTLVGTAAEIPNPNQIGLPGGSISATMTNKTLTGTFVMNVRYSTGLGTYRVAFTATQVRP